VGRGSPELIQASERAKATLQDVVDHAYWRIAQLIGFVLLGSLVVALAYRGIARRWLV
jgi:hypothetical protein